MVKQKDMTGCNCHSKTEKKSLVEVSKLMVEEREAPNDASALAQSINHLDWLRCTLRGQSKYQFDRATYIMG